MWKLSLEYSDSQNMNVGQYGAFFYVERTEAGIDASVTDIRNSFIYFCF